MIKIPYINSKVKLNDKDCILVEFEGDDIPYLAFGRAYMRVGDEDRQLSMKEIRKNGFMVIFYRKTDEELLDLTGENRNATKNVALNDGNVAKNIVLKVKEKYPKLKKVYIDIIEMISKNNYSTQEEIVGELNKTRNSIYRNIKVLKDMGILERLGSKKNGYWKGNI